MSKSDWPEVWGYTDFCDDIRQELWAKNTLVGVYSGELKILVPPPIAIPQLCLFIRYFERNDVEAVPLELRIFAFTDENGPPTHAAAFPPLLGDAPQVSELAESEGYSWKSLQSMFRFNQLVITQPGAIKVRMKRGDKIVKLGSLRVSIATPEDMTAYQALAEQAPQSQLAPPSPETD